ncbi:MAG: restriction endonuclease subunit S [Anaerobutyricum soehngenii]
MRIAKLNDIAELKTGPFGTQFSASEYVSEGIPVINVKNIGYGSIIEKGLDHVSKNTLERLSEHKLKEGDIVFGRKGSVDRHCLIRREQNGWMQGSDCIRVRFTDASVYSEFVSYYLLTDAVKMKINNSAVGSTMASLNTDILGDIDIILPDYAEQKSIALTLGIIDKKIKNNNRINDYLCSQIQFLFSYLFNLSNAPKSWDKGVLSDIANITMGQSPSGDSYNIIGKGCPFYQGSTDFGAIFPTMRMYTDKPSRYAKVLDTLLSVRAPVGSLNIAYENCCIGRGLASIHGKYDNNTFVRYLLKNNRWYFDNINNSGTTFGSITKNYLFEMPITIPDGKLVSMFEQKSSLIEQQIYKNEQQIRELSNLRDWLLPMLMNGQATIED